MPGTVPVTQVGLKTFIKQGPKTDDAFCEPLSYRLTDLSKNFLLESLRLGLLTTYYDSERKKKAKESIIIS